MASCLECFIIEGLGSAGWFCPANNSPDFQDAEFRFCREKPEPRWWRGDKLIIPKISTTHGRRLLCAAEECPPPNHTALSKAAQCPAGWFSREKPWQRRADTRSNRGSGQNSNQFSVLTKERKKSPRSRKTVLESSKPPVERGHRAARQLGKAQMPPAKPLNHFLSDPAKRNQPPLKWHRDGPLPVLETLLAPFCPSVQHRLRQEQGHPVPGTGDNQAQQCWSRCGTKPWSGPLELQEHGDADDFPTPQLPSLSPGPQRSADPKEDVDKVPAAKSRNRWSRGLGFLLHPDGDAVFRASAGGSGGNAGGLEALKQQRCLLLSCPWQLEQLQHRSRHCRAGGGRIYSW